MKPSQAFVSKYLGNAVHRMTDGLRARLASSPFNGLVDKLVSYIHSLRARAGRQAFLINLLYALATAVSGVFVARMIVRGDWQIAAVLIFSIPAIFLLQRYPFLSVLVWLVLAPFLTHTTSSTTRQVFWVIHRFMPLFTLVIILLPSALGLRRKPLPRLGFPEMAMLGYIVVSLLSIVLSNNYPLETAYLFYDRIISPMFLYLIVRLSSPDKRMFRWLIRVALFIALSQVMIGILSQFVPGMLPTPWVDRENHRTIGTLVNTNVYITTLILTSFLVLHHSFQSDSKRMQALSILTFLLVAYAIFISYSRAGWLAGILAVLGLAAIYPRFVVSLVLVMTPVFLLVGGLFLGDQLQYASQRFLSEQSEQSALTRLPAYTAGIQMFITKPLFGWGYGNFDEYSRKFQTPIIAMGAATSEARYNEERASHNFFLSILAEQGLAGILLYMAPVFYWLGSSIRNFSRLPRDGFWSRKVLLIFWLVILSHIIVYNFANMRVVFGLGNWWLSLGLIGYFMDSYSSALAREKPGATLIQRIGDHAELVDAGPGSSADR